MEHTKPLPDFAKFSFIKGKPSSSGYAYARPYVATADTTFSQIEQRDFPHQYTLHDFHRALESTRKQLRSLHTEVEERLSDAASLIFTAHLLMLDDHSFISGMETSIQSGENPPKAVIRAGRSYMDKFAASADPYIREKAHDVADLVVRTVRNMISREETVPQAEHCIVITREIFPSDILRYSSEHAAGIIQIGGGVTSHVSILARSLTIPMVIANEPSLLAISADARILLDAELGNIYVDPGKDILKQFPDKPWLGKSRKIPVLSSGTATADGKRVQLLANINLIRDVKNAFDMNCDGIGLYRSEFPFIIRRDFPLEEEQYIVYRKLVEGMPGREITFRTLDVGGDKVLPYSNDPKESNPFLGLRSIRFSLANLPIFRQQLLAVLRAGHGADLKIMFPMISSVDELLKARQILDECIVALRERKVRFNETPKIGMMVEIPSVINIIDHFIPHVDFMSIGTNDLVQYYLAVDRANDKVADYYVPHHPAVLNALNTVAEAAVKHHTELSVCGDMANSDKYLTFLIGIGIRRFSMDSIYLPRAQKQIASISALKARKFAAKLLMAGTISEVESYFNNETKS